MAGSTFVRGLHRAVGRSLQERTRDGVLGRPGQLQLHRHFEGGRGWEDGLHLVLVPAARPGRHDIPQLVVIEFVHVGLLARKPTTIAPIQRWLAGNKARKAAVLVILSADGPVTEADRSKLVEPALAKSNERLAVRHLEVDGSGGEGSDALGEELVASEAFDAAIRASIKDAGIRLARH